MKRIIKAPTGNELTCKNWLAEAAYRIIQNNLDAEVAFDPDNLIIYGRQGKEARKLRNSCQTRMKMRKSWIGK